MMVKVYCSFDKMVPIGDMKPNPRNPNSHPDSQVKLLAKIIDKQGWRNPIVISTRSNLITKGHARLMAARLLKLTECPVDFQDYETEAQEYADMIADNRIAELAEMDMPAVKDLLEELDTGDFDMDLTGYDSEAIEELMTQYHIEGEGLTDEDAVPEATESICKPGELWILGNHRLLCGDATKKEDVERLMGGEKADMVFTDPPYGIDFVKGGIYSRRQKESALHGDKGIDFKKTMAEAIPILFACTGTSEIWLCCDWRSYPSFYEALEDFKLPTNLIVWDKKTTPFNVWRYTFIHEFLLYFGNNKAEGNNFKGTNVWQIIRETSKSHPTAKPVELCGRAISDSSKVSSSVLDLFGGSGSTLIACEKLNRRCFMMEIDPHYCDVIIKRWEEYTGGEPVRLEEV